MKKLGSNSLKWLKIIHLGLVALFLGGIISSYSVSSSLELASFDDVYITYKSLITISDYTVRYGAQGTLILGFIYGVFTNWGFIKHKWIAIKWTIFIAQTFIGILVVDKLMVANMVLLETEKVQALTNPVFIHNHELRHYVVIGQILLTLILIVVSVFRSSFRG